MDERIKLIADTFGTDRVKLNHPVAEYTILNTGGLVKLFFIAFNERELVKMIELCRQLKVPFFLFGTGSKIMLSDSGFDGVVIKNRTQDITVVSVKGKVSQVGIGVEEAMIEVSSGVSIGKLIEFLNNQGLSGEELTGVPGSVGGSIFVSRILQSKIKSIKVLTQESDVVRIEADQLQLRKHIVLSVIFKIKAK